MPKIALNGRSFYYEEIGTQGDPLVFLSGLGGDHRAFTRTQRHFASRFRTLSFNARDAGQSDRSERSYTTADMADDVAGWLEAIGAMPAHVVGQSLGGLVARRSWLYAIPMPSRAWSSHRRTPGEIRGVRRSSIRGS